MKTKAKTKKHSHLKSQTKKHGRDKMTPARPADPYPAVEFPEVGDAVAGRIVGRLHSALILETDPGDASSRVMLYVTERDQRRAIAEAVRQAGRKDLAIYDDLAMTFAGYDGTAMTYRAAYTSA